MVEHSNELVFLGNYATILVRRCDYTSIGVSPPLSANDYIGVSLPLNVNDYIRVSPLQV
jgi:hypothetical protein